MYKYIVQFEYKGKCIQELRLARPLSREELKAGLQNGTIKSSTNECTFVYREVDGNQEAVGKVQISNLYDIGNYTKFEVSDVTEVDGDINQY